MKWNESLLIMLSSSHLVACAWSLWKLSGVSVQDGIIWAPPESPPRRRAPFWSSSSRNNSSNVTCTGDDWYYGRPKEHFWLEHKLILAQWEAATGSPHQGVALFSLGDGGPTLMLLFFEVDMLLSPILNHVSKTVCSRLCYVLSCGRKPAIWCLKPGHRGHNLH